MTIKDGAYGGVDNHMLNHEGFVCVLGGGGNGGGYPLPPQKESEFKFKLPHKIKEEPSGVMALVSI